MDLSAFAAAGRAEQQPTPEVLTAVVVRADESGLWVAPVGDDPRHPVGPCRGGWTANGTRIPPGQLVALTLTADGPWVLGFDNPALAISDAELAPFPNPSFEDVYPTPPDNTTLVAPGWHDFWSSGREGTGPGTYTLTIDDTTAAHGKNSLRCDGRGTYASVATLPWSVPPGSSLEVIFYAKAIGPEAFVNAIVYSSDPNTGGAETPGPFGAGVQVQGNVVYPESGGGWLRYRAVVTLPATHRRVAVIYDLGSDTAGSDTTVWLDRLDVNVVDIDPTAAHQDFLRRATATLTGGGIRTVTAGGNVRWSQPLTTAGAGLNAKEAVEGRFDIAMPTNGVVIPVHHSLARTSVTVAGDAILLNPNEALWYELPLGQVPASQPGRFHVLASELADGYVIPPHWILVVRRTAWSSTAHAPEYLWGDGQQQDPWRTPDLNTGWSAGTVPPRFAKGPGQVVRLIGRVKDGVGSAFTLPPGYHPAVIPHDDYVPDGAGNPALIAVTTSGVVTTAGSNTDHSIATTFVAGQ